MSFVIKKLWAYLAVGADGEEGIMGMKMGDSWMPFVMGSEKLIESLRPIVKGLAAMEPDKTVRLVSFSTRTDIEVIDGSK